MAFELDTKALRYFVAVATNRSFTLAAAHLRITQPAITRQIQAIEKSLGVRLFVRIGNRMELSEAGRILLPEARDILSRLEATQAHVRNAASVPTGRLAIGAPSSTGEMLLPSVLLAYQRKFPEVFIQITTRYSDALIEMLIDGRLDMALIFGLTSHIDLELQPLFDMDLGIIAPHSPTSDRHRLNNRKTITLAQAASLPLISPTASHPLCKFVNQMCASIDVTPNTVLESDSLDVSKTLVAAGMGYMFLGEAGIRREARENTLRYIPVTRPTLTWQLSIATRRMKSQSLAVRLMIDDILEAVKSGRRNPGGLWRPR